MLLSKLVDGAPDVEVTDLAYDHRRVEPGAAFFCVRGLTRDGHELAAEAVAAGAAALVVDHELELAVPQAVVPDVRAAMAPAAAALHGDPTATLKVAGVTGTNGKTTTAYLLRALLEADGQQTALLGTVAKIIGGQQSDVIHTTPEAIDLQREFAQMLAAGDENVAMEVSSHALELHRADAIDWEVAVFTNLSEDHLDFHGDMDSYFAAKRKLFAAGPTHAAVNVDDEWGKKLAREFPAALTFGIDAGDLRATDVEVRTGATGFRLEGDDYEVPLPGRFNVLNALGAIAAARALGADTGTMAGALANAETAPGRFQPVDAGQRFTVIVDYAHTPDALKNVLAAARSLVAGGRVIVVFGAGGDRDRDKRPLMGAVAAEEADIVIVTSDNPRSEEPEAIIADVVEGAMSGGAPEQIVDRRAAIERGIELANEGDIVVIAGKGHEQGQEFADGKKLPFDDFAVAGEVLSARLER
jgi:UDP-N-acetylmuramoyl-L-alanyl-D-glutamate--2,6-diaminopimelate ligase